MAGTRLLVLVYLILRPSPVLVKNNLIARSWHPLRANEYMGLGFIICEGNTASLWLYYDWVLENWVTLPPFPCPRLPLSFTFFHLCSSLLSALFFYFTFSLLSHLFVDTSQPMWGGDEFPSVNNFQSNASQITDLFSGPNPNAEKVISV